MEFVYSAFNNTDSLPIKGKISRWRHLETTITQCLIIGLILFLIMQNSNLRKEISDKMSHEVVEDIFSEKMIQFSKEIEEIKSIVLQRSRKNSIQTEELKKIVKILIKELGLPLADSREGNKRVTISTYQGTQTDHRKHSTDKNGFRQRRREEEFEEEDSMIEEESEMESEEVEDDFDNENEPDTDSSCTYVEYFEDLEEDDSEIIDDYEQEESEEQFREYIKNTDKEIQQFSQEQEIAKEQDRFYMTSLHSLLVVGGHLLLASLVFLCLFILSSVMKNPKYRNKSGQTFDSILKVSSSEKEHNGCSLRQKKILSI